MASAFCRFVCYTLFDGTKVSAILRPKASDGSHPELGDTPSAREQEGFVHSPAS
jgi:hypothetical protein